jgi:hypothetical protein
VDPAFPVGPSYAGRFKLVPVGLGLLLTGSHLPDARAFYCPSGDSSTAQDSTGRNCRYYYMHIGLPHDGLRDWQNAGGYDGRTLTHGNWQKWYWYSSSASTRGPTAAVLGQYAYRNQQIVAPNYRYVAGTQRLSIPYTNPRVYSDANCPPFKTPRLQGGRALISDSFAKGFGYRAANGTFEGLTEQAGYGAYCHVDGYNVLYGDYSSSWFGDNEQRLIYWTIPAATKVYYVDGLWSSAQYSPWGTYVSNCARRADGLPLAWHVLDEARGIDIGAAVVHP